MVKNPSKRQRKNKPTSKKYKFYKIEDGNLVREKTCPRCGVGVFLMKAKDRLYCGKCHYTKFLGKKEEKASEEKKVSEEKTEEKKEEKPKEA